MKTCPSCSATYDDSLTFCLNDGAVLIPAQVDAQATRRIPPPPQTNPSASTAVYNNRPAPAFTPPQYGAWAQPQPQKSSGKMWLVIVGVVVLVLGLGAVAGLILLGAVLSSRKSTTTSYNSYSYNSYGTPRPSPTSGTSTLALAITGIWNGTQNGRATTLRLVGGSDNTFRGVKIQGETEVLIEGSINPSTRELIMKETQLLRGTPYSNGKGWSLGTERGTLSADGRSMSGTGNDQYNPTTPYQWSYTK